VLSWKRRKQLIVVVAILIFANILLAMASDSTTAADEAVLHQVDTLVKQQKYSEAIQLLKKTLDFRSQGDTKPFESRLEEVQKLQASDTAFSNGMHYYSEGDFPKALEYFRQVSPKDVNNFTAARTRICELETRVVKDLIREKKTAEVH